MNSRAWKLGEFSRRLGRVNKEEQLDQPDELKCLDLHFSR